jgi:hypothetical protein
MLIGGPEIKGVARYYFFFTLFILQQNIPVPLQTYRVDTFL